MNDSLKNLSILHDAFVYFLNMKAYEAVAKMMDAFTEANNVNEINTVLIITAAFKDTELRRPFERLKWMLEMMLRFPDARKK